MAPVYLSHFLEESTPAYGGIEGSVIFKRTRSIDKGDTSNNMELCFPNHMGTHIDFPYHFDSKGKRCQDYPPSFWIFRKVGFLDCPVESLPDQIKQIATDIEILLLKTGFGKKRTETAYWASQPVIPAAYAGMLRERFPKLRVFGFDMISLTSKLDRAEGKKAHLAFLIENEILILEDMNFDNLSGVPDNVVVQPLQVMDADGVPCSVIAY
jgi:arylformamidase